MRSRRWRRARRPDRPLPRRPRSRPRSARGSAFAGRWHLEDRVDRCWWPISGGGPASSSAARLARAAALALAGWLSSRRPRSMGDPEGPPRRSGSNGGGAMPNQKSTDAALHRGAPGIRATRLGRGLREPDCRRRDGRPRVPRTSSGWRSPPTCSDGPRNSWRPGPEPISRPSGLATSASRCAPHTDSGWSRSSGARWPREAAGSPAQPGSSTRPAMTGSNAGSC